MAPTKENRFLVTVARVTGGPVDRGTFDSFEGGEVSGEAEQYHAGGMARPTSDVSTAEAGEITIGRGYDPARDAPVARVMRREIGYTYTIGVQPLDAAGNPIANTLDTWTARLVSVETPSHDSMGRGWARFALRFVPEGLPA